MAYTSTDLALIAQSPRRRLWDYWTADAAATVDTTGYFNGAATQLRVGDVIFVTSGVGGTPAHGIFVVLSNTGTVVDVGDAVALGGSDTD